MLDMLLTGLDRSLVDYQQLYIFSHSVCKTLQSFDQMTEAGRRHAHSQQQFSLFTVLAQLVCKQPIISEHNTAILTLDIGSLRFTGMESGI